MKRLLTLAVLLLSILTYSQTDFSDRWEDMFSYANVKDFVKVGNEIYALADNAIFIYNTQTQTTTKRSSVHGLSGETTSAIHYNLKNDSVVIGYETGLLEVINVNGEITTSPEITNFIQTGNKRINHIYEHNDKLYLATDFAIVVYDIDKLEFGDTYFIGAGSTDVVVNGITVYNDIVYAATENGVYTADVNNPNLIDAANWNLTLTGNYSSIVTFNNQVFAAEGKKLKRIIGNTTIKTYTQDIRGLKISTTSLAISTKDKADFLNTSLNSITEAIPTTEFNFDLNKALEENGQIYLGTTTYGILEVSSINLTAFKEIHPEGPLYNDVFAIDAHNNHVWTVFGGHGATYAPLGFRRGYSHFTGGKWLNSRWSSSFPIRDLTYVTIDKNHENRVIISSMGGGSNENTVSVGGLMIVENDEVTNFYNTTNSPIEKIPGQGSYVTIRIVGTEFDRDGNLWITNIGTPNRLKKLGANGQWEGYDLSSVYLLNRFGMNEIVIDGQNTKWIGTRGNGVYIFNEQGNRLKSMVSEPTKGGLPNLNARTVEVDRNNRVWIGTLTGLVVYNNALNIFNDDTTDAEPVIILDDGEPRRLLGEQTINTIEVDGGDNKWFGTENGGVLYTNPSGQTTIAQFTKDNSPLPSNKINKIRVDNVTGKVYFATDKGLVAYNSKVAPFGEELGEVYAYPNPVLKNHNEVTIDGRNGTHLPKGTNVKILDTAGNLVYETNVVEGQELQGGKVVWNKRNLAGTKVATGIYMVLLSTEDGSQSSSTKIAIVN